MPLQRASGCHECQPLSSECSLKCSEGQICAMTVQTCFQCPKEYCSTVTRDGQSILEGGKTTLAYRIILGLVLSLVLGLGILAIAIIFVRRRRRRNILDPESKEFDDQNSLEDSTFAPQRPPSHDSAPSHPINKRLSETSSKYPKSEIDIEEDISKDFEAIARGTYKAKVPEQKYRKPRGKQRSARRPAQNYIQFVQRAPIGVPRVAPEVPDVAPARSTVYSFQREPMPEIAVTENLSVEPLNVGQQGRHRVRPGAGKILLNLSVLEEAEYDDEGSLEPSMEPTASSKLQQDRSQESLPLGFSLETSDAGDA